MKKLILPIICSISLSFTNNSLNDWKKVNPSGFLEIKSFKEDFEVCLTPTKTSPMITYFNNLYDYSPKNSFGSCGYVSFIQYLSYFDTFYNDNIIPEQFEKYYDNSTNWNSAFLKSPGVLRQDYPEKGNELYNFIEKNKDIDYQAYLMSVANEACRRDKDKYSYEIGMWNYNEYLINNIACLYPAKFNYTSSRNFKNSKPTDKKVIDYFDNYVKSELDKGNPVVLHICKYDENGSDDKERYKNYHSVVAYYYDESGIHANFGYDKTYTDTIISKKYQITEAGTIDFSIFPIKHSDNYKIYKSGNCGCKKHISHSYTCSFEYKDNSEHIANCFCGDSKLMHHVVTEDGKYVIGGKRYAICLDCNSTINLDLSGVIVANEYKNYITSNGSYKLENGVIVLSKIDYELYKKGELNLD